MTPEQREQLLDRPITCPHCGHVIPLIEGWMFAALAHHRAACHGVGLQLLNARPHK